MVIVYHMINVFRSLTSTELASLIIIMFDANKTGYELSANVSLDESFMESVKQLNINDRDAGQGTSEITPETNEIREAARKSTSSHRSQETSSKNGETQETIFTANNTEATDQNEIHTTTPITGSFRYFLFEQGLKAMLAIHLAIGIVSSVAYMGRQIVEEVNIANKTWQWVGILRSVVSILTIFMILWAKILINTRGEFLDNAKPENKAFFYCVIIISAAISWIHFLLCEFRNFSYFPNSCAVAADLMFPLLQMAFIMVAVMLISDLIFHTIKPDIPRRFYVIYKSATLLMFMNCVSSLIFNIFDIESTYIQNYIASRDGNTNVFCLRNGSKDNGFVRLQKQTHKLIEGFPVILFISSIAIILKPLEQFSTMTKKNDEEKETILSSATSNTNVRSEDTTTYTSTSIIYAIIAFIMAVIGIPLDMINKDNNNTEQTLQKTQISFNVLPLILLITVTCASAFLLKWLHDLYPLKSKATVSKVDYFIIWVSLVGHLVSCFKYIINSLQFLITGNTDVREAVSGLRVTLYLVDMVQSMLQAVVLDLITQIRSDHPIRKNLFSRITQPVVLLASINLGLFVTSLYLLNGKSSFVTHSDIFNRFVWDVYSCISDPLSLVFRAYSAVFFVRFLSRLRSHKNGL